MIFKGKRVRGKSYRRGFTLLELVVVVMILGMLSALLVSILNAAGEKGQMVGCKNNIKQVSRAHHLYLEDYNEYFVQRWDGERVYEGKSVYSWHLLFHHSGYLGSGARESEAWYCPANELRMSSSEFMNNYQYIGYGYSFQVLGSHRAYVPPTHRLYDVPGRLPQVRNPSKTLLMTEARFWRKGHERYGYGYGVVDALDNAIYNPSANHDGVMNVGHVDGSVSSFDVPGYSFDEEGRLAAYDENVLGAFGLPRTNPKDTPENYWRR